MLVFSLTGASQENTEVGKRYNFLMEEDYTQGSQSKDKESRKKVFDQVISCAAVHHACHEPW